MSLFSAAALAELLLEWTEDERRNYISKLGTDGYSLVDEYAVGSYTLALWKGNKSRDGVLVMFYEMSLNLTGHDFTDEESQTQEQAAGSVPPRRQMLQRVAQWLSAVGQLYVGSFDDRKLAFYQRLFRRAFPDLKISAPFPAFDDSVKPDYFVVSK